MRRSSSYHDTSWAELYKFGVKFAYPEKPDRYNIDDSVRFGEGVIIWPDVILDGNITIGKNSEIGKGAVIIGTIYIGNNVKIKDYIKITGEGYIGDNSEIGHDIHNPKIGTNCKIGDAVIIDSIISDNCEIGTRGHAVIERSFLGTGVKAKHSCGIRDAYIDYDVNISEFVTIANLAAGKKSRTKIGSRTMIGVAVRIMGGSEIGEECYIADGARVDGTLAPRTYFNPGRALKNTQFCARQSNCSWYLAGMYLVLKRAIGPKERISFHVKAFQKCWQDGDALKEWLKTPILHLGGRTPLEALQTDGEKNFDCILGECKCSKPEEKPAQK
ncbi:MAG: DUF2384 domain-containing protein [bacterium]|nr:DUF2384 domain-containing protein [bacterium]